MALNKFKKWLKQNLFPVLIIICAILGLGFGFIIKSIWEISPVVVTYIGLPGILVIRAFTMILVPLIVASLANSIVSTKSGENKRLIALTFVLFIALSTYAPILGTLLVVLIKPGVREHYINETNSKPDSHSFNSQQVMTSREDAIHDVLINLIPNNIISATFMQHYTALVPIDSNNISLGYKKVSENTFKTNYLGICIFSLILGFTVLRLDSKADNIKKLLEETNSIVMEIVKALMKVMPIGMFSWMCVEAIKMKSPETVFTQLVWFFGTAFLAFFIHLFIVLSGIYFLIVHKNPFEFYCNILPAIIVAFGSASSAFTLPMTLKCMEENNKLPESVTRFVLPLGMTVHMNGFAMYYPMVTLFVAQMHGIDIGVQHIVILCLFALIMSVAVPAVPSGGGAIVTFMAFSAVIGIDNPLDVLAYTMTVDWFMGRMRTTTNIIGDCFVAAIVHKLCAKSLAKNNILRIHKYNECNENEF